MHLQDLSKESILEALGLQSRRTVVDMLLPTLAIFGAGLLAGAGLGLMLATKPGAELRRDLGEKLSSVKERVRESIPTRDVGAV